MKQNIVLIPSKTNKGYDTLILSTSSNTVLVNVDGNCNLEIPDKKFNVETTGKDWFDYTIGSITTLGAIIAAFYTWKSIRKLYQKDEDKQEQINKLTAIAGKMEAQNQILEEANRLTTRQIEALQNMTLKSENNEGTNELARIERERMELEYRPRLYSNMASGVGNEFKFVIENGGKDVTITNLVSQDANIQVINTINAMGTFLPEGGVFNIGVRSMNGAPIAMLNYNIDIHCINSLGIHYLIHMNSRNFNSLRNAVKIDKHED
jgi:hypothetical protein